MVRAALQIVLLPLLVAALGCSLSPFACEGDDQCMLSGEPGVCVAGGRCAYPEPDCPSGLAFPQGAPSGAGECVPAGDTDAGTTGAPASSTGEPPSDTEGADTTADGPGTDSSGGDSSSSGAPPSCDDPTEPNDTVRDAVVLPLDTDCASIWSAAIEPRDEDWFRIEPMSEQCITMAGPMFALQTEPPLEVCIVPLCVDGTPDLTTCSGEVVAQSGADEACCDNGQVSVDAPCGTSNDALLLVRAIDDAVCVPYEGRLTL